MKMYLVIAVLLIATGKCEAQTVTERSEQAWLLSSNGTKQVECYFWATKAEVSIVACKPMKHPTDDVAVIIPSNAVYFYHTHPRGFPQLSDQDKAAERKTGIKIRVIYH